MSALLCRLLARLFLPLLAVLDEAHSITCEELHRSPAAPTVGCGTDTNSLVRAASTSTSSVRLPSGR